MRPGGSRGQPLSALTASLQGCGDHGRAPLSLYSQPPQPGTPTPGPRSGQYSSMRFWKQLPKPLPVATSGRDQTPGHCVLLHRLSFLSSTPGTKTDFGFLSLEFFIVSIYQCNSDK